MQINIKFEGLEQMIKELENISKHKVPKVAAMALTATAKKFRQITIDQLSTVFDRPTPWIKRGVFFTPATTNNLSARVWFKDRDARTTAADVVAPHVYGGGRKPKPFEKALQRYGRMLIGTYAMPGKGARLNRYGNISSGTITKALTAARALEGMSGTVFYGKGGTTKVGGYKLRKGTENYFLGKPGGKPLGVWQRYGRGKKKVKPILIFVDKTPQYKKRLPFFETAEKVVPQIFRQEFSRLAKETIGFNRNK